MCIIMMYMSCPAIRKLVAGDEVFSHWKKGSWHQAYGRKKQSLHDEVRVMLSN